MPQLQKGSIYMEPRAPKRGLREETGDILNLVMQMEMQNYLRQQEMEDALTLAREKAKIQSEYGGMVNIVDPTTGEVRTVYTPGGKGRTITTPAPKKMTEDDLGIIGGQMAQRATEEAGHLGGFPGLLERGMPFGGVARRRGIRRRTGELMKPFERKFQSQFAPRGDTAVSPSTITGKFTGGIAEKKVAPPQTQVPPEIAAEYPDAYQGPDGAWYVDKDGKTYRIDIE